MSWSWTFQYFNCWSLEHQLHKKQIWNYCWTITNFDIFLISESKIDSTFPNMQFKINVYKLFRRDCNRFGGGLIFYLNEEISCKFLNNHPIVPNAEIIWISSVKSKWLLLGCYKPPRPKVAWYILQKFITKIVDF